MLIQILVDNRFNRYLDFTKKIMAMETIETLTQEIIDKLDDLDRISYELSSMTPVTHKSQSNIQWHGGLGIIETIQENKENKRLNKLMNEPLVNGKSFYQIALSVIPEAADFLVERQLKIQNLISKDDKRYYGFVVDIVNYIEKLTNAWYNYSPDMANEVLNIGDEKGALAPSVFNWTKDSIKKLDLLQNVAEHYAEIEKEQSSSSGCLGTLIIMFISSSIVFGGTCYGLYHLII